MSWPLLPATAVQVDCFDVTSCQRANLFETTYKTNSQEHTYKGEIIIAFLITGRSFCCFVHSLEPSSKDALRVCFFNPFRLMHMATTLCFICVCAEMIQDAVKVRGTREQSQSGRDGEALKSLWVDFHCGNALLSYLLRVCSSKDTDSMLLLFDFTWAVFLIRTTLGSKTVLVIGLL